MARCPAGTILFPRLATGTSTFFDEAVRSSEGKEVNHRFSYLPEVVIERMAFDRVQVVLSKLLTV
jgi:hypothetical protein